HRMGLEAAKRAMLENPINPGKEDLEKTIQHVERLVVAQGLKPEIEILDDTTLRFRVYNCTFQEATKRFSGMVCKMHNALLRGIFEAYFGEIELKEEESMLTGCQSCTYTVFRLAESSKRLAT
ncbi:MAG: transcriptional regulator, partial [Clostridia bacterium]